MTTDNLRQPGEQPKNPGIPPQALAGMAQAFALFHLHHAGKTTPPSPIAEALYLAVKRDLPQQRQTGQY